MMNTITTASLVIAFITAWGSLFMWMNCIEVSDIVNFFRKLFGRNSKKLNPCTPLNTVEKIITIPLQTTSAGPFRTAPRTGSRVENIKYNGSGTITITVDENQATIKVTER